MRWLAAAVGAHDFEVAASALATQGGFLADHLCNWVPLMTADVRRFARTAFYKGLASLTEGYLEMEQELLGELLGTADENDQG